MTWSSDAGRIRWMSDRPKVERMSVVAIGKFQDGIPYLEQLSDDELDKLWQSMHDDGERATDLFLEAVKLGRSRSGSTPEVTREER